MEEFKDYINKIKSLAKEKCKYKDKEYYIVNDCLINLWYDNGDYLDGLQYKKPNDIYWTWSKPKEFYEKYCDEDNQLKFIKYQIRYYREPKLQKPKELKGVKQAFSVEYIQNKCRCKIFVKDNDVWIQHNDYFSKEMDLSSEDQGLPLEVLSKKYLGKDKKAKFVYPDAWGAIILRNQAWLCIKNLIYRLKLKEDVLDLKDEIVRQQERVLKFKEYELAISDMDRFFERLVKETAKYIKEKNLKVTF